MLLDGMSNIPLIYYDMNKASSKGALKELELGCSQAHGVEGPPPGGANPW